MKRMAYQKIVPRLWYIMSSFYKNQKNIVRSRDDEGCKSKERVICKYVNFF